MKQAGDTLHLSATDLANHLACRHLTTLDLAAAGHRLKPPPPRDSLSLDVMRERGMQHEAAYLEHLRGRGLRVVRVEESGDAGLERTRAAMTSGVDVIAQATLAGGRWTGIADVLLRVEGASRFGDWSYEAVDTKLARETRGATILQLGLYSDLLGELQGVIPEFMSVVRPGTGFEPERFRVSEYLAYYRLVRRRLEASVAGDASLREPRGDTYPQPVPHCEVCRWWPACDRRRRDDDHLSFVAGIARRQTAELEALGLPTLAALGSHAFPGDWRPRRGTREGFVRVREQARVQLAGRRSGRPVHELLPVEPDRGLARLPAPDPGDVFLDLEGDPFAGEGGREYLFGRAHAAPGGDVEYAAEWALDRAGERAAFERFVDFVLARLERFPNLHVYHFAPYEPAALKRLMGRYATREAEIDRMLRAGLFVDLHAVVRQSLRASVESYSIKDLEPLFGFRREQRLDEARGSLQLVEWALESGQPGTVTESVRRVVEGYNRDDCRAAFHLRRWLESLRDGVEAGGRDIPRPAAQPGEPGESLSEREERVRALRESLTAGVPEERDGRTGEQQAVWLLAHMLDWHRREEKAPWWEFFRLRELSDEELLEERAALAGLTFVEPLSTKLRGAVHRYTYPPQETSVRAKDELQSRDVQNLGKVVAHDPIARTLDIRKSGKAIAVHPTSVFAHTVVGARVIESALLDIGEWVAGHGVDAPGRYRAGRDLLLRRRPRLASEAGEGALRAPDEAPADAARRLVSALDHGVLAIQGPPGSGKTRTGARMICDLVRAGRKVGVTATSHKVIRKLLDEVVIAAGTERVVVRCAQKIRDDDERVESAVEELVGNEDARAVLREGRADVLGGTAWMWCRPEFLESVDVLFVDEAGQMSLANTVAVAQAAGSLVLLGDPQQLQQPVQGSHPPGTAVSALEHVLEGQQTMPAERGLFLAETWRLHPSICAFTSELFYDARLSSRPGLERQRIDHAGPFDGAGLWFVPVEHDGNQSSSPEEVDAVAEIVRRLTRESARWIDREGNVRPLGPADVLVVAPYNAQVADLGARLPGIAVGTVDKFQGQEAPVVIYSMTTSRPEDAPRGMDFLYSLDRLNVATSRARGACIVVGSPRLFEPDCQTPVQMRRANALCRFLEMARVTAWGDGPPAGDGRVRDAATYDGAMQSADPVD